jgi:hypothetical protein
VLQHLKEKILKIIILRSVFLIILLTALISCSEENTTEPVNNPPSNIPASKLSDIQVKVFTQSCALSGCHGSTNNQASLLLTEGNSFNNLVNIQSLLFPQFKRVAPDTSSNSLLIKMLKGEVAPQMPLNRNPLSDEVIDSIAAWIDKGAINN